MRWGLLLVLWAGVASAQGVLVRSSSSPSPTRDDVATRYSASATSGVAYGCDAQLQSCLKAGPGADTGIGTDGSGRLLLASGPGTGTACIGDACELYATENGNLVFAGSSPALILNNNGAIYNQTSGKSVPVDAAFGLRIVAKALGTCSSANEGALVPDASTGGNTGTATHMCMCSSNGSGVYTWINLATNAGGTASTCP